jgi:hypothetical protein
VANNAIRNIAPVPTTIADMKSLAMQARVAAPKGTEVTGGTVSGQAFAMGGGGKDNKSGGGKDPKPKGQGKGQGQGKGKGQDKKSSNAKSNDKKVETTKTTRDGKALECWTCGGNHYASACPELQADVDEAIDSVSGKKSAKVMVLSTAVVQGSAVIYPNLLTIPFDLAIPCRSGYCSGRI